MRTSTGVHLHLQAATDHPLPYRQGKAVDSGVDLSRRMVSDLPAAAAVAAAAAVISGGPGTQVAALEDRALQVK